MPIGNVSCGQHNSHAAAIAACSADSKEREREREKERQVVNLLLTHGSACIWLCTVSEVCNWRCAAWGLLAGLRLELQETERRPLQERLRKMPFPVVNFLGLFSTQFHIDGEDQHACNVVKIREETGVLTVNV